MALHGQHEGFVGGGQGLTDNEVHIVNNALELTSKTARSAMTPMDKARCRAYARSSLERLLTSHSKLQAHVMARPRSWPGARPRMHICCSHTGMMQE